MAPHRVACSVVRRLFLTAFVSLVALVFLLGPGAAQAATVLFDDASDPTKATGILNLDVPGFDLPFNVVFDNRAFAIDIYGPFPGDFTPIDTITEAEDARDAVILALRTDVAEEVGEVGLRGAPFFSIGFASFVLGEGENQTPGVLVARALNEGVSDWAPLNNNPISYIADQRTWAVFTPIPEPGTALMLGLGLAGLVVVGRSRREESQGTA